MGVNCNMVHYEIKEEALLMLLVMMMMMVVVEVMQCSIKHLLFGISHDMVYMLREVLVE
jgi:hypothetical protein